MSKVNFEFLECAAFMPELQHKSLKNEFNIADSDAAQWLCHQPEIMQKIFDWARLKGLIVYDADRGVWKGINFDT